MPWLPVGVAVLALLGFWIRRADSGRMLAALERLVARHGGAVKRSALSLPRLEIPRAGAELVVSGVYGDHASTFAVAQLAGEQRSFEIGRGRPRLVEDLVGPPTLGTGDERFDAQFRVRSEWPLAVDRILDGGLRRALLEAPCGRGLELRLRPLPDGTPRLDLCLDGVVTDPDVVEWLAETALLALARPDPRSSRGA